MLKSGPANRDVGARTREVAVGKETREKDQPRRAKGKLISRRMLVTILFALLIGGVGSAQLVRSYREYKDRDTDFFPINRRICDFGIKVADNRSVDPGYQPILDHA